MNEWMNDWQLYHTDILKFGSTGNTIKIVKMVSNIEIFTLQIKMTKN